MTPATEARLVPVKAMISPDEKRALEQLAEQDASTVSREIRRAVRTYLARELAK